MYATSHGDNSSNDETTLVSKQVARVLQSCFDRGEKDTRAASDISIDIYREPVQETVLN